MGKRSFTLPDLIERNALLFPMCPALLWQGGTLTHEELLHRTRSVAAGLAAHGVSAGDRVAVLASNGPAFVDLLGAVGYLGAVLVPINHRLAPDEIRHVIRDVRPRAFFASENFVGLAPVDMLEGVACFGEGTPAAPFRPLADLHREGAIPDHRTDGLSPLVIIHTAAVGGVARGSVLSHSGLLLTAYQASSLWQLVRQDLALGALPLFHVGGLCLLFAAQLVGAGTILEQRFEAERAVDLIDQAGASLLCSFPPMLSSILDVAERRSSSLRNLRIVTGIDLPGTIERLHRQVPAANFWSAYGQTETSGFISLAPFRERPGSAGRPTALHTVAIVDDARLPAKPGQKGEIVVRGPGVHLGYWPVGNDEEPSPTDGTGAWHGTGDIGHLDDEGYLWFGGRSEAKELIKTGGENVYPAEVERILLTHPALAQAAVVGVPDAQWGEAILAVCVPKAGAAVEAHELIEFVGRQIARYKKPRHVVFVDALPQSEGGAIDRAAVKERWGTGAAPPSPAPVAGRSGREVPA